MRSSSKLLLLGALLAFGSVACGDFLSGRGLTTDPNAPSNATRDQRLAAVQASMTVQLTGDLARNACMWMQQCAGVDRQYAGRELYNTTSTDFNVEFAAVYVGGGLIDIKAIEADAAAAGDLVYEGVGRVLEALDIGTAADLWGDIPYSQAAGSVVDPPFDSQESIYTALLAVLDSAIAELGGAGNGPGAVDLWYGAAPNNPTGDVALQKTEWRELAHTLKARIYLHLAQRNGTSAYASALAEASLGLSTAAHDLRTYQSATTTENNLWYQFQIIARDTYLRMGAELVDSIMKKRNDPRLAVYFSPISPPAWAAGHKYPPRTKIFDSNGNMEQVTGETSDSLSGTGAPSWNTTLYGTTTDNHVTWTNVGPLPYAGAQPGDAYDPAVESNLSAARLDPAFHQPLVTYPEVQLIIAEAAFRTGDQVTARTSLNAERATVPLPAVPVTVVDSALMDSIMVEKYVVMFQTIESWNDVKRECRPALVPTSAVAGGHVISRPFYGVTEESANPNALPDPVSGRNWNDPRSSVTPVDPCP